ncbi:MAG: long-chain fatty acid--CoA ligase [bacterium]
MQFHSIPDMIRDRVNTYQDRVVFRFRTRKTGVLNEKSWNGLYEEYTRLSKALLADGFGHADNIGLFSPNCPEWTVTDLAILNIRGVTVPFFSTASKEQCKYIVDETDMRLLFAGEAEQLEKAVWLLDNTESLQKIVVFNEELELPDARCVRLKDYMSGSLVSDEELLKVTKQASRDDLATIIYTSGTTGEPKGVMLSNDNFLYTFEIHQDRLDLNEHDISMAFLPLSHIFERTWTFYLLYCGGTNFYLDNPREIIDVLPLAKPTVMCTVPRFFEKTYEGILAEAEKWPKMKKRIFNWSIKVGGKVSEKRKHAEAIPFQLKWQHALADRLVLNKLRSIFGGNIRTMPCSGAALPIHLLKFFHATGIFVNYGYGATETTATVSCFKTDQYEFESCGTVMPQLELKISEENEIMVRGRTIFKGYYKKPEATQEVLVDGWYKTGDEGQITANGNLLMTDRLKDLMKTSVGKYISPQKLETLIGQDPMIEQVVVVGDNRKYVTALIVPVVERLHELADELEIKFKDGKELLKNAQIREYISDRINALQRELSSYEKVRDFTLLPEPFSIEANTLTSTLKTKRKVILERYWQQIEAMYK